MQISIGLDQVGRGSLIGSMFICAAIIILPQEEKITKFRDSKTYINSSIIKLYNCQIKDKFKYQIAEIFCTSPSYPNPLYAPPECQREGVSSEGT